MPVLSKVLKTYRIVNLFMIALTQFIVSQFIVEFYQFTNLVLISLSCILIALGGYFLNDIADIEIDLANNKNGIITIENKDKFNTLAYIFIVIGNIIGFYLCFNSSMPLFLCYIGVSIALISYAKIISKYKVLGNILIATLIAMVILVCFYIEINNTVFTQKYFTNKVYFIWLYTAFAFMLNWMREVVKDIEDIKGDTLANRITLPNSAGIRLCKSLLISISILLLISLFFYIYFTFAYSLLHADIVLLILLLLLFIIILLKANDTLQYKFASSILKSIMFLGIIIPVFL